MAWSGKVRLGEAVTAVRDLTFKQFNPGTEGRTRMAVKKKDDKGDEITVVSLEQETSTFRIIGRTPLIYNRMSAKALRELLSPAGPKNKAERAATLKHDPLREYQDSVYRCRGETTTTRLQFPAPAIKGAIMTAALETPGATKAQIGRLVWVHEHMLSVYGVPQLFMTPVRSAGMNRTPDVRTRAILSAWGMEVSLSYTRPQITAGTLAKLITAAGMIVGIGDFRQEKGAGSFGRFEPVNADDERWQHIVQTGHAEAQDYALENPTFYDAESEELFRWFEEQQSKRTSRPKIAAVVPEVDAAE